MTRAEQETKDPVIATINGRPIRASQAEAKVAFQLYRLRGNIYLLLKKEARRLAQQALLEEEAARRGITVEELLRREVEEKLPPIGEEEVEQYLMEHAGQGWRTGRGRHLIRTILIKSAMRKRREEFLKSLWEKADFRFLLELPQRPRCRVSFEGQPSRGPGGAEVTVVHFGSLTHELSRRAVAKIRRITERFPQKVRWIHRNLFPMYDREALVAAQLAETAHAQGIFWTFHDLILSRKGRLSLDEIRRLAVQAGLDLELHRKMEEKGINLLEVKRDLNEARRLGISPPSVIFVNGLYFHPTFPFEQLLAVVKGELNKRDVAKKGKDH
jgi:hypothetical protein